jgi:hypothetical protein
MCYKLNCGQTLLELNVSPLNSPRPATLKAIRDNLAGACVLYLQHVKQEVLQYANESLNSGSNGIAVCVVGSVLIVSLESEEMPQASESATVPLAPNAPNSISEAVQSPSVLDSFLCCFSPSSRNVSDSLQKAAPSAELDEASTKRASSSTGPSHSAKADGNTDPLAAALALYLRHYNWNAVEATPDAGCVLLTASGNYSVAQLTAADIVGTEGKLAPAHVVAVVGYSQSLTGSDSAAALCLSIRDINDMKSMCMHLSLLLHPSHSNWSSSEYFRD